MHITCTNIHIQGGHHKIQYGDHHSDI